jgi:hypothetical protein
MSKYITRADLDIYISDKLKNLLYYILCICGLYVILAGSYEYVRKTAYKAGEHYRCLATKDRYLVLNNISDPYMLYRLTYDSYCEDL